MLASLPDGTLVLSDQLCVSPIPELIAAEASRLRFAVIVHHPLALEGRGATGDNLVADKERVALTHARLVIATSRTTAEVLVADYGVRDCKLVVALPGTDLKPPAVGSGTGPLQLLSVGAVVPRKGHDILVEALARLGDLYWRVVLVGNVERAPDHVAALRRQIAETGLEARIAIRGELPPDELEMLWLKSDLYVSASRHEGYGMAVSEALARGLPVVATRAGAVAEWLPTAAGVLVPDEDAGALAIVLGDLIRNRGRRVEMQRAALVERDLLPQWTQTASVSDTALAALL